MIKIESYSKKKKNNNQGGGVGNSTVVNSSSTLAPHSIWGNLYDGTQDINGDIKNVKNITASESVNCNNITANTGNIGNLTGNAITSQSVSSQTVTSDSVNAKNVTTDVITSKKGNIDNIVSNTVNATDITSYSLSATTLQAGDTTISNLNVTGAAHFYQLMLDNIKSNRGQTIVTAANAKIYDVRNIFGHYVCFFPAEDGVDKIGNMFAINDLCVMQTFNAVYDTNYNVTNRYYWRKVIDVSKTPTLQDGKYYHWVALSATDCDTKSNAIPMGGDEIVQLGNTTDASRQSAIIISAYNSQFLDNELVAPSISQYNGINRYELKPFRVNVLSKNLNEFVGNFKVQGGKTLEESLKEKNENEPPYIGGNGHWYIWDKVNKKYVDSGVSAIGQKGENGENIKLTIENSKNIIDTNNTLSINANGYIKKIANNQVTTPTDVTAYKVEATISETNFDKITVTPNSSGNWNIQKNIQIIDKTNIPSVLTLKIIKNNNVVDTLVLPISLNSNSLLEITDSVKIMAQNNQQKINELTGKVESNTNSIASINVKNNQIESKVNETITNITDNYVTNINLQSVINQRANEITLSIIKQVNGNLKRVGIDIDLNEINLIANKTNFVDENGKKFITVSKDENGIPHFIFLDNNEKAKYDLGYTGLKEILNEYKPAYWTKLKLVNITDKTLFAIYPKTLTGTDYFRYIAARHHVTGALGSHAEEDGKVFDAEQFRKTIPDGYYTDENLNGNYLDMSGSNMDNDLDRDTRIYSVAVTHFVNGRIDSENSGNVLFKVKNNKVVGYCDANGKAVFVRNGQIQNYPFVK
nr:MAG TPA: hypothetical protein [Caudoviricetes sp.]